MWPLRLAYYVSLGLLFALVGLTVRGCATNAATALPAAQMQLGMVQELPDHWIVSFDLINNREEPTAYRVTVVVDGQETGNSVVVVKPLGKFGYFYHVLPRQITNGEVTLLLYDETGSREIDRVTYYLLAPGAPSQRAGTT